MGMESILVVSAADKGRILLEELRKGGTFDRLVSASTGGEARRMLVEDSFDLVLINVPLPDEAGLELARRFARSSDAGIVMLVRAEQADAAMAQVEDDGVLVVPKPLNRTMLFQSLKMLSATRQRVLGLKTENDRLQRKIEEIRLVDRAKCVLIQKAGLSEQQAHRYLEKKAMDSRITRREAAEELLRQYRET